MKTQIQIISRKISSRSLLIILASFFLINFLSSCEKDKDAAMAPSQEVKNGIQKTTSHKIISADTDKSPKSRFEEDQVPSKIQPVRFDIQISHPINIAKNNISALKNAPAR